MMDTIRFGAASAGVVFTTLTVLFVELLLGGPVPYLA